jgi:VCBS repeat-containing protein
MMSHCQTHLRDGLLESVPALPRERRITLKNTLSVQQPSQLPLNGVLANDTDADRDALTVSGVTFGGVSGNVGSALTGTYGTLVLKADSSYSFVADQAAATALVAGQSGTDVFNYTVEDGHGGTSTGTLTFKVNGTTLPIEGLELAKRTVTKPNGSLTRAIDVPVVSNGGVDGVIEVPVAKSASGQTILSAIIPVGVGMQISGSPSAQEVSVSASEIIKAIQEPTQPGSADQQSLTSGAQGFLSSPPSNGSVLVQTADIMSAPTNGQPISISGAAASAGAPKAAVVVDASSLPSGTVLDIENVDFVMVIGAVRVTGGSGSQTAWGDDSGQWMVLGADDDVLHGGGGDDYVGSHGGNDRLYGDEGNDTVSGGVGNNTLDGGTGVDLMLGGTGTDTYYFDSADDTVIEYKGEGTDTIYSSANHMLTGHVENLVLNGNAHHGYGNGFANVMHATDSGSLMHG